MTDRQKLLVYAALVYAHANLDDVNEAYESDPDEDGPLALSIAGVPARTMEDAEFKDLIALFTPAR